MRRDRLGRGCFRQVDVEPLAQRQVDARPRLERLSSSEGTNDGSHWAHVTARRAKQRLKQLGCALAVRGSVLGTLRKRLQRQHSVSRNQQAGGAHLVCIQRTKGGMERGVGGAVNRRQRRLLQLVRQRPEADGAAARQLAAVAAAKAAVRARVIGDDEGVGAGHGHGARPALCQLVHAVQAQELNLVAVVQGVPALVAQQHGGGARLRGSKSRR